MEGRQTLRGMKPTEQGLVMQGSKRGRGDPPKARAQVRAEEELTPHPRPRVLAGRQPHPCARITPGAGRRRVAGRSGKHAEQTAPPAPPAPAARPTLGAWDCSQVTFRADRCDRSTSAAPAAGLAQTLTCGPRAGAWPISTPRSLTGPPNTSDAYTLPAPGWPLSPQCSQAPPRPAQAPKQHLLPPPLPQSTHTPPRCSLQGIPLFWPCWPRPLRRGSWGT